MLINCPECGKQVSDKAVSCPQCGCSLKESIICPECGNRNKKGEKTCVNCGYPFEEKKKCAFCDDGELDKNGYCNSCGMDNNNLPVLKEEKEEKVFYEKPVSNLKTTNDIYYARPKNADMNKLQEKQYGCFMVLLKGIGIFIAFFIGILILAGIAGSCTNDESKELTAEDFDTYDEYVEYKRIVPEETGVIEEFTEEAEESTEELETEIPEITMEEYIAECKEYSYKDVLRNPSYYVGQKVKIVVEISSVHEASWLYNNKYYFAWSEGEYGYYTGDYYAIIDKRYDNSLKLLEEDVILVYGEIAEPEETKSYIVNSEELFTIDMRYVELLDE